MKLEIVSEKEFMEFVNKSKVKNFFQTVMMKHRYEHEKKEVYLVGLKEKKKVVAAALLTCTDSFCGYKVFEAYKGFILDYANASLLKIFTEEVIAFLKGKKAMKLIIDPYLPTITRNADGEVVEGQEDNRHVINSLLSLGYKSIEGDQVKWTYCLDLEGKSEDDIFREMQQNTRNCIQKTINKYKLEMKTLSYEELPLFKKVTEETCDRKHFADRSLTYYQNMYTYFKDDVTFKMVCLNCDTYITSTEEEIKELKEKMDKLSDSNANEKKKENIKADIANFKKRVEEVKALKKEKGNSIPLSVAMFMLYGDEIVYLFSGSYSEYMHFFGQYRIQWEMISYGIEHGYKRYNFYGIKEFKDKNSKDYGVYKFKKGFGGYIEELLGPFEKQIHPINHLYNFLKQIKRKIRK